MQSTGADVHACGIFCPDTGFGDDMRHMSIPYLSMRGLKVNDGANPVDKYRCPVFDGKAVMLPFYRRMCIAY